MGRTGRAIGALALALIAASGCGGSSPSAASGAERAACARIEAMYRDRIRSDTDALRADLEAALQHADRSGNDTLHDELEQVQDGYDALFERPKNAKPDDEWMTMLLRASAHLTLAVVECRERGIKVNQF